MNAKHIIISNVESCDSSIIETILYLFRVGNSKSWSDEISFKTDCPNITKHIFAVMGDMGTVIPAGFLVTKQITQDHQVTPFSAVVHVGDISYAGTGSTDEIAVSLERWRIVTTILSLSGPSRKFGTYGESR
jgi:hypothetical protein